MIINNNKILILSLVIISLHISFIFGSFMEILRGVYIDCFSAKKVDSLYFLTHWHADHYSGITASWSYGPIYCSNITKKIMLTKYPKLKQIAIGLQLNKTYELENRQKTKFQVTLYDSNHIAGSVIILLNQNNRYTLHTGDMRFNGDYLQSNNHLFYKDFQKNEYKCKFQIHTLYLDNTYCDPIFMFPNRSDALQMIKEIIEKFNPGTRKIYLVTDSIGKEEAFLGLSLYYQTKIGLDSERMKYIEQMLSQTIIDKLFYLRSQNSSHGNWIQVIKRKEVEKVLKQDPRSIVIRLTGWANLQASHPLSDRQYIVPYSLHSNYQQLQLFMSIIKPKRLFPVVRLSHNKSKKFRENIHTYSSYFNSLMHMQQRGFNFFAAQYVTQQKIELCKNSKNFFRAKEKKEFEYEIKRSIQQEKQNDQLLDNASGSDSD